MSDNKNKKKKKKNKGNKKKKDNKKQPKVRKSYLLFSGGKTVVDFQFLCVSELLFYISYFHRSL